VTLYERVAATPEGARGLAKARLRTKVIEALWEGIEACGGEDEFRQRTGLSKRRLRRVSTERKDIRITDLADWLHAAGFELEVTLVPVGQPRAEVLARREEFEQLKRERDDALDRIDYVRHAIDGWNSRNHALWREVRDALGDPTWTGGGPISRGKPRPKPAAEEAEQ
jgi:hypothetical protein